MENWFWIPALGWAVANSLWQAACCWLFYRLVIKLSPQSPAHFRHLLSLLLLGTAFGWFVLTAYAGYEALRHSNASPGLQFAPAVHRVFELISFVYLLMLAGYSVRFYRNLTGLRQLHRATGFKAPAHLRIFTEQTALQLGIRRKLRILLTEKVDVPSVLGVLKPVILLPVNVCTQLSTAQLEAVILHELAHIRRYDYLVNLLQAFLEMLLFFNPFIRMLGAAARKERENSCDDWVLNYQYDRRLYATALLQLEQQRRQQLQLAMAATSGEPLLLTRIQRLFAADPVVELNRKLRLRLLLSGSAALMLLLALHTWLVPGVQQQAPAPAAVMASLPLKAAPEQARIRHTALPGMMTVTDAPASPVRLQRKTSLPDQAPAPDPAPEPTLAFVNEELLRQPAEGIAPALPAAETSGGLSPLLLKVEEEQSGSTRKITYIAEFRDEQGNPVLQPLILLRSPGATLKQAADSLHKRPADSLRITPLPARRITS